jgi:membrane-associated phospholipid phosphatase
MMAPRMKPTASAVLCVIASIATLHAAPARAQTADDSTARPALQSDGTTVPPNDAPIVTSDDRPFTRLFPHLFTDLRRLPSRDSAVVFGVGAALSLSAYPIDRYVSDHASAGGADQFFAVGSLLGGGYAQAGGAVAAYVIGRLAHAPRLSHTGADLIRAQALSGLVTHGVKLMVRRDRPDGAPGHFPASYSFPSGHASATWTSATVLWRHFGWKAGVPASVLATYVAASRVQQHQHFLSDVVFGAALGIASGRTVTVGHRGRAFVAAPMAVPGGAGVLVTLVTD